MKIEVPLVATPSPDAERALDALLFELLRSAVAQEIEAQHTAGPDARALPERDDRDPICLTTIVTKEEP